MRGSCYSAFALRSRRVIPPEVADVLPAIYLLFPPDDAGGFNSEFAADLTGAHWVAVAVWVLFAVAVALTVSTANRRRRAGAPPGAGAGSAAP